MDPAGYNGSKNFDPVQTQPQWQNTFPLSHPNENYTTAIIAPGLKCLVEVDEVTLQKKVFFDRSEQTLFTIRRESECCGPAFNLRLQDPYRRDVVSLYRESDGDCCGGVSYLKIIALPGTIIGYINISNSSHQMNVSIQMKFGETAFTAELPLYSSQDTIEILSVNGSYPVAKIIKEGERKSSKVIFQFPLDMDVTLKALILAAFLYMRFQLNRESSSSSSSDNDWGMAAGGFFVDDGGGDWGGGGGDWGGDCGGGDWGGGGDCGGGGGGDCGGEGGGDCGGGGGGDCGGGGCD